MTGRRRCARGRSVAGLAWVGVLLLVALASLPLPGSTAVGALAAMLADADSLAAALPRPPAPRDTTGQAELRWQVERPRRQASLLQAERSVYRVIDGEAISFYYGNVYLDRDTVVVRADSAHVLRDRDIARLFDHVRIRHHDTRVASRWAEYRRELGEMDLRGDVRVVEGVALVTGRLGEVRDDMQLLRVFGDAVLISPEYTVRADTLVRDRRMEHGEAFGHVKVMDPDGGSLVTGDHGLFAADGSWAEVDKNPELETREEGGEPVLSRSGTMRFYRAEERAVMVDSVRIVQGEMRAFADTAISYGRDRMLLLGDPRLEQGERSRMRGDVIEFFYRDGALYRVVLVGRARMEDSEPDSLAKIYRGLPAMDIIEGDSITVHFRDGVIDRTDVVGHAHSVYVPLDAGDEIAFNDVAGDTMVLRFGEQKVREVEVRGNMTGTYQFASVLRMRGALAAPDSAAADSLLAVADSLVAAGDTAGARQLAGDVLEEMTARADSLLAVQDSLAAAGADSAAVLAAAGADTLDFDAFRETVEYSGHSVLFDLPDRTIEISDDASLTYGTMNLTARDVILDTASRELYADGDPVVRDSETIVGNQMGYDFGNKTGAVRQGITTFDGYYYAGDRIQRYPDGSLKIHSGRMTSCDLREPHYHFWGDKMKMRLGDRVVTQPLVMKVGNVPVFALPFFGRSLKEGRRSGILFPNFNFGWSSRDGRYIRDFGYYWATNDYTDFTFEIDYNERRELAWRLSNRYVKRYAFNGGVSFNRLTQLDDDAISGDEWQLRWNHDQPTLFDDYKFRAQVEMASRELSRNDLNRNTGRDVISGQLKSTVYVSRNWSFGGTSLNADRTEYTNATDDDPATDNAIYNMTLPSVSLNFRQLTLGPQLGPGEKGSLLGDIGRNTYFSQSYAASNVQSETELTKTRQNTARGNWNLTVRPPRLGIFNWNFGASSAWNWSRTEVDGAKYHDTVISGADTTEAWYEDISDVTENSRPTLSINSGVSTTLYGVFPVPVGPLQAIRHTLNMSASASYRPQLGSKQNRSSSYGLSMGNRFDVKYLGKADTDSTREVKKLDGLLDWTLSTSYNPDAERQWSNIGSGVTFKPGRSRNLAFKLTNSVDPYLWKVLSTRFNYGFNFQGKFDTGYDGELRSAETSELAALLGEAGPDSLARARADSLAAEQALDDLFDEPGQGGFEEDIYGGNWDVIGGDGGRAQRDDTEGGRFIPWSLGGSFSLNHDAVRDDLTTRANLNVTTQVTRDWSLRYTASFDLEAGATTRQEYRLTREMHCWRLEFTRTLSTTNNEFGFRFFLKAIPELKLTRGREDMLGSAQGMGGLF